MMGTLVFNFNLIQCLLLFIYTRELLEQRRTPSSKDSSVSVNMVGGKDTAVST